MHLPEEAAPVHNNHSSWYASNTFHWENSSRIIVCTYWEPETEIVNPRWKRGCERATHAHIFISSTSVMGKEKCQLHALSPCQPGFFTLQLWQCVSSSLLFFCQCVCVCVCEWERERGPWTEPWLTLLYNLKKYLGFDVWAEFSIRPFSLSLPCDSAVFTLSFN